MSDTSPFGFGKFVPGFDFLQNLAKNASESSGKIPGLSSWIAPTMSVEDLEKRVEELKAVQFWLEQNSRALTATIQALEVQKMTLSTLKGMNVSMGDMASLFQPKPGNESKAAAAPIPSAADAFAGVTQAMTDAMVRATSAFAPASAAPSAAADKSPPVAAAAPAPAPAPQEPPVASDPQSQGGKDKVLGSVIDPMQWWGALTQQFQQIAANALQDVGKQASLQSAASMTQDALKNATDLASQMAATGMKSVQDVQSAVGRSAAPARKTAPAQKKSAASRIDKAAAPTAAAKKSPARSAAPSKRVRD